MVAAGPRKAAVPWGRVAAAEGCLEAQVCLAAEQRAPRLPRLMRGLLSGKGSWKPAPIRRDWRRLCLALIRRAMVEVAGLIRLTQPRSSTGE